MVSNSQPLCQDDAVILPSFTATLTQAKGQHAILSMHVIMSALEELEQDGVHVAQMAVRGGGGGGRTNRAHPSPPLPIFPLDFCEGLSYFRMNGPATT